MLLGYSVETIDDWGHSRSIKFFEVKGNVPSFTIREKAVEYASVCNGVVIPVGVLSDEEIELELQRSKVE